MTESMIERVAKALTADFEAAGRVFEVGQAEDLARVAIEAMREPTELMLDTAESTFSHFGGDYGEHNIHFSKDQAEKLWPTMIDAALQWPAGSADRAGVPLAED